MSSIGFIGLGNMGSPMAENLVNAGHSVRVYDINTAATLALQALGAVVVPTAAEAARDVEAVITMLPNGAIVEATYLGEGGLIASLATRPLLIDCSTIAPESARKVASAAIVRGFEAIDAPVSGGVMGARAGTLSFIVGGTKSSFERAKPILGVMGKNLFHAGDNGAGQLAKICNNMLAAVLMVGTAEALALGVRNGLDPKELTAIIRQSTGNNFMVENWNPWPGVLPSSPASKKYVGGFQTALMLKDLGLALASAQASAAATPMGAAARNLLALHMAQSEGNSHLDMSSIQRFYTPDLA